MSPDLLSLTIHDPLGIYPIDVRKAVGYDVFSRRPIMAKQFNVNDFFARFPDDDACLAHLMKIRYGEVLTCPKCGKEGRFAKLGKVPAYSCPWCGHHIHPMVGTPFAKSHVPLQKWFYAMFLFSASRHGVSGKELQRQLGVTYKTAYRMGMEIRKYIGRVDGDDGLSGHVEIDESYIGGRVWHKGRGQHKENKSIVFGMVERGGDVMTQVVSDARARTVQPIVLAQVESGSRPSSDESSSYTLLRKHYIHKTVHHAADEYVFKDTHTNTIEGFWAILKRSIRGTHIHVSEKKLPAYLGEFEYRYNMRKFPEIMFPRLLLSF